MAKLMMVGDVATVEILANPEDEELILVKCREHLFRGGRRWHGQCNYGEDFDTTDDASAAAELHADGGR